MFVVVYQFSARKGCEQKFILNWLKTTRGIYLFKGSLGSRLHKDKSGRFIAYAQWPSEQAYRNSTKGIMPRNYEKHGNDMKKQLDSVGVKILFEMEVQKDFLKSSTFPV
ncbi:MULTISPECIES: antibiotic biosynthesis monooxygenase [Gammaproteobacteria]|uniref:antibiotic biosynthesis monooxygenase family protein n=1 Tax=Gammaproteobacteria TaxID=1236 RepID=UPI000DCFF642|nr:MULTISPECIES: antibiotic biosynthesis monooxygenase [Gammaproteobacteria]RTE86565.1 antibiotic biosynthesis monooxygenase [Aliidiomarina sp. B3213]TCZ90880.1 antibiotic biosynthesis monooxygenase [Lysobacter sp. N42]